MWHFLEIFLQDQSEDTCENKGRRTKGWKGVPNGKDAYGWKIGKDAYGWKNYNRHYVHKYEYHRSRLYSRSKDDWRKFGARER